MKQRKIYEAKKESKLQDFVEVSSTQFDRGNKIVGLGNKKPKLSYKNKDKNYWIE